MDILKLAQLNGLEKWPGGGAFAHPAGLTRGAFEQLFGTGGREFLQPKIPRGLPGGGGGMLRLQIVHKVHKVPSLESSQPELRAITCTPKPD